MQNPTPQMPESKLGFARFAELWRERLATIRSLSAIVVEMANG